MFEAETLTLAQSVLDACRARGWHVATAESCTGGLVAGALTAIAGSSDVVERGFVTYSNEAKSELLGVPAETIAAHGAVSAETAAAMAEGAVARAPVDLAVSVAGVAGPGVAGPEHDQRRRKPELDDSNATGCDRNRRQQPNQTPGGKRLHPAHLIGSHAGRASRGSKTLHTCRNSNEKSEYGRLY